ncbi:MAG TPA: alkaline phosphatase family protein [Candidatus Limnocylindrales bacterium]
MRRTAIALLTAASALSCTAAPASPGITAANRATGIATSSTLSKSPSTSAPATSSPSSSPSAQQSEFATLAPTAGATAPAATAGGFPAFDHVYLIVMENREYGTIVGNSDAPYINSLIASYGLATNYDAIGHPSEPNYIALFAGSTLGVTTDGRYDLGAYNLADQLDAAGKSWHVYEQDYPGQCSPAASAYGGVDLIGLAGYYFRKHDPAISFTDISGQPARCAAITSLSSFSPSAANFELIVPNTYNDMHSAPTATGDAFLKNFVPLITNSPAFANGLLVITWDEGSSGIGGGGQVATLVISPLLAGSGMQSSVAHNHYSLLRTIEVGLGLPCLGNSCEANDLSEFFG